MEFKSNLVAMIEQAIDECINYGSGSVENDEGIQIDTEWVDSKREGYSVICITITEDGVIKFCYEDYGTECEQ